MLTLVLILDGDTLLESESLYIPVPPSEMEQPREFFYVV